MAADTTDVLSAANGVWVGYLYGVVIIPIILTGSGYSYSQSRSTGNSQCISRGDVERGQPNGLGQKGRAQWSFI